jgi:hypothetical protein
MSQGNEGQFIQNTPPSVVYSTVTEGAGYAVFTLQTETKQSSSMVGAGQLGMTVNVYYQTTDSGAAAGTANEFLVSQLAIVTA